MYCSFWPPLPEYFFLVELPCVTPPAPPPPRPKSYRIALPSKGGRGGSPRATPKGRVPHRVPRHTAAAAAHLLGDQALAVQMVASVIAGHVRQAKPKGGTGTRREGASWERIWRRNGRGGAKPCWSVQIAPCPEPCSLPVTPVSPPFLYPFLPGPLHPRTHSTGFTVMMPWCPLILFPTGTCATPKGAG